MKRNRWEGSTTRLGFALVPVPIFLSEINFDIFNIRLGLKQKSGNWKMATLKLSSQLLQTSIMALVFLSLISISAVNDFLCVFLWGNKNYRKMIYFKNPYWKLLINDNRKDENIWLKRVWKHSQRAGKFSCKNAKYFENCILKVSFVSWIFLNFAIPFKLFTKILICNQIL